ncbi:MAG: hypothetical protein ABIH29_04105 [Candidatus Micrarchaeota archaeon]
MAETNSKDRKLKPTGAIQANETRRPWYKRAVGPLAVTILGGLTGCAGGCMGCGGSESNESAGASTATKAAAAPAKAPEKAPAKAETSKRGRTAKNMPRLVFVPRADGLVMSREEGSVNNLVKLMNRIESDERRRQLAENEAAEAAGKAAPYPNWDRFIPGVEHFQNPRSTRLLVAANVLVDGTREDYRSRYGVSDSRNIEFLANHRHIHVTERDDPGGRVTLDEFFRGMANKTVPRTSHFLDISAEAGEGQASRADRFISLVRAKAAAREDGGSLHIYQSQTLRLAIQEAAQDGTSEGILTDRTTAFNRWIKEQSISHLAGFMEPEQREYVLQNDKLRGFLLKYAPEKAPERGTKRDPTVATRTHELIPANLNRLVIAIRPLIEPRGEDGPEYNLEQGDQEMEILTWGSQPSQRFFKHIRGGGGPIGEMGAEDDSQSSVMVKGITELLNEFKVAPGMHPKVMEQLVARVMREARTKDGSYDFDNGEARRWASRRGLDLAIKGDEVTLRMRERPTKREKRQFKSDVDQITEALRQLQKAEQ